jgi:hypothetical protein
VENQCIQSLKQADLENHKRAKNFHLQLATATIQEHAQEDDGKFSKMLQAMKIAHSCVRTKALMGVASSLTENASSWLEREFSSKLCQLFTKAKPLLAM